MRAQRFVYPFLVGIVILLVALPAAAATQESASTPRELAISDSRTGSAPCGFPLRRDIEGVVEVAPSIDDGGNLVLSIDRVALHGSLANPANDKSVDLKWVRQNGAATFQANGTTTTVALALTGSFSRGYDIARTDLEMRLPIDSAEIIDFEPGGHADDPWTHVRGLLS